VYFISLVLVAFAFPKFYNGQFQIFQHHGHVPLKEVSPFIHAWSFFGRSYAYNLFLGLAEFTAACFILFRRTRLIGLLIALARYINILFIDIVFEVSNAIGHVVVELLVILLLLRPYVKDLFQFLVRNSGRLNPSSMPPLGKFGRIFPWVFILVLVIALSVEARIFLNDQEANLARFEVHRCVIHNDTIPIRAGKYTPVPMLFLEFGNTFVFAINDSTLWGGYQRDTEKLRLQFDKSWYGIKEIEGSLNSIHTQFKGKDNLGRVVFWDLSAPRD
jgi:hypothetical protein